jgi:hypothetical protein
VVVNGKLSSYGMAIVIGAGVSLLGSLLDVYGGHSAWAQGLFPLLTLPAILVTLLGVRVLIATFANRVRMPVRVLGFTWGQIDAVVGAWAALMMLSFAGGNAGISAGGLTLNPTRDVGFWLMFVGTAVVFVGGIIEAQEQADPY